MVPKKCPTSILRKVYEPEVQLLSFDKVDLCLKFTQTKHNKRNRYVELKHQSSGDIHNTRAQYMQRREPWIVVHNLQVKF